MIFTDVAIQKQAIKRERIDYFLFFIVTCLLALVVMKGFTASTSDSHQWLSFDFSFDTALPPFIAIPSDIGFLVFAIIFMVRRKVRFGKKELLFTALFIVLATYRILTYVYFPETPFYLDVNNPFNNNTLVHLTYNGYPSLLDMVEECIAEVFFLFYLYLVAVFFFSMRKDEKMLIGRIIICIFAAVAVFMTIYSMIFEWDGLVNNFYNFIGKDGYENTFINVKSITSNRNVFGFFITLGVVSQILMLFKKPNVFSIIVIVYLSLFSLLLHSRTTISICFLLDVLTIVSFVILYLKKHPVISSFFILALIGIILFFLLTLVVFKDSSFSKSFAGQLKKFFDFTTINMRKDHLSTSFDLVLANPYFFWIGLGRVPFLSLYHQYLTIVNYEPYTVTSHCGVLESFFFEGAIMGIFYLLIYAACIAIIIYLFVKKQRAVAVSYGISFIGLFLHMLVEPRGMLIIDSTSSLFFLIFLLPLINEYSYYLGSKQAIINNRRYDYLSYRIA